MTKIFDEEVVFKQKVFAPQLTIQEGGEGDLSVVDDLFVTDDATIGGNLAVTGETTLAGGVAGDLDLNATTTASITGAGDVNLFCAAGSSIVVGDASASIVSLVAATSVNLDGAEVKVGTDSAFSNVITIGGVNAGDVSVGAASTIALEAPVLNIGVDTSIVQYISLGHASAATIGLAAATSISVDAAAINIGTDTAYSAVVTIDGVTVNLASAIATSVVIGVQDSAQALGIYGGAITLAATDLIESDATEINVGTDSALSSAVTIGNLANTTQTVSVYGGSTVDIDGPTLNVGTSGASAITLGSSAADVSAYGNSLYVNANVDTASYITLVASGNVWIDAVGNLGIGNSSALANASIMIGTGELSAQTVTVSAGSSIVIDSADIDIGPDTTLAQSISIGNAAADTIEIDAATAVNIDALAVGIGADTSITAAIISVGHATQGTVSVAALAVNVDGASIDIGTDTTQNAAISIGCSDATSISVVCGAGSASIGGAYVDIGTATTMSNYVTLGSGAGGSVAVAKLQTVVTATVTALAVSAADLGKAIIVAGDSTCAVTLPGAATGLSLHFATKTTASAVTLTCSGGDYFAFVDSVGALATASSITAFAGVFYNALAIDGTVWVVNHPVYLVT